MAKILTNCQIRCQDCPNLIIKNNKWLCKECFENPIEDIDDCPEGISYEMVNEIEQRAKENNLKMVVRGKINTKKTKERKPDEEKEKIIQKTAEFFSNFAENVKITNISKIIEFDIGENHYKFDLIRQRKPKN